MSILGEEVEGYRCLSVHLDNRPGWKCNTKGVSRKGQSRLYSLRNLGSFNVSSKTLHAFYQSVLARAIFFAAISWSSGIRASDAKSA